MTEELQHLFPCGGFLMLTNLPFIGTPQTASLILSIFKYKQAPCSTQECVYASVTQQHAQACPNPQSQV